MKAVIDRITGQWAILLIGEEQHKVDFPLNCLPRGVAEGDWLTMDIQIDPEQTRASYETNRSLLDRILRKNQSGASGQ